MPHRPLVSVLPFDEGAAPSGAQWSAAALAAPEVTHWVLTQPGVTLPTGFTAEVAEALVGTTRACLYTAFTDGEGHVVRPGGWSPERARWQDYTGPVIVAAAELAHDIPAGVDPRVAAPRVAASVFYLPEVRYGTTQADEVRDLDGDERRALVSPLPYVLSGTGRTPSRALDTLPTVSVVIPTRGSSSTVRGREVRLVDHCLSSLGPEFDRPGMQIVLVMDSDADPTFIGPWRDRLGDGLTVITTDPPFNFAGKINAGASAATGEILVMLNDDVEPLTPGWVDALAAVALEPDVGAVGALLLYEDGTVQHQGHAFADDGVHLVGSGTEPGPGPRRRNECDRDVTGVTAACLVQRKVVWQEFGGLDESFPVAFNDVDYCERMRAAGLRIVLCNSVRLHHFESRTRPGHATPREVRLLRQRWGASMSGPDPLTEMPPPPVPAGVQGPQPANRWRRARQLLAEGGVTAVWDHIRNR